MGVVWDQDSHYVNNHVIITSQRLQHFEDRFMADSGICDANPAVGHKTRAHHRWW